MMETGRESSQTGQLDRSRPPQPGSLRPYSFPEIHSSRLETGVPVYAANVDSFPIVTVHLLIPAGGATEEPSMAGLASLTCALLDAGAAGRSATEIAEAIEGLGVDLDAGVSWDAAYVSLTALRSRLEPALDLLADLLRRPDFPGNEVDRLRGQRLAEILQRRADPRALATETAAHFIYAPESPYSRALSGVRSTVEGITRSDLERFHSERFRPGGATAVAAGDIGVDELVSLLDGRLADWIGAPESVGVPSTKARSTNSQVIVVDRPGAVQSEIRIGHVGVGRSTPDYFPLIVGNAVLGGMFSSRLNLNLRERHGFTYGVSSGFTMRRDSGAFLVSTAVQTEVTHAAVREIFHEVNRIREAPPEPGELADARQYLAGVFPLRLQTTDGTASRVAELALHSLPLDYFDSYRDRILEVEASDAADALSRHVRPDEAVVVVVGDAERLVESLNELGLAPVQVFDPEALEHPQS